MVRTRFSTGNIVLFVIGAILACINVPLLGMIFGFGDMHVSTFRNFFIQAMAVCDILSAAIFIMMCMWCKARAVAMWCTTALFALCSLLGGVFGMIIIPLIILAIVSGIASAINAKTAEIDASIQI
jgi:hypothetical protein